MIYSSPDMQEQGWVVLSNVHERRNRKILNACKDHNLVCSRVSLYHQPSRMLLVHGNIQDCWRNKFWGKQISSSIITELLWLLSRCQDDQQMVRPGIKVQAKGCSVKVEHLYSDDSYINNFSLVSPLSCRQIWLASFVIFSPDRFKDFFNSHSATDCIPASLPLNLAYPPLSPILTNPTTIPPVTQAGNWEDSLNTSLSFTCHILISSQP